MLRALLIPGVALGLALVLPVRAWATPQLQLFLDAVLDPDSSDDATIEDSMRVGNNPVAGAVFMHLQERGDALRFVSTPDPPMGITWSAINRGLTSGWTADDPVLRQRDSFTCHALRPVGFARGPGRGFQQELPVDVCSPAGQLPSSPVPRDNPSVDPVPEPSATVVFLTGGLIVSLQIRAQRRQVLRAAIERRRGQASAAAPGA